MREWETIPPLASKKAWVTVTVGLHYPPLDAGCAGRNLESIGDRPRLRVSKVCNNPVDGGSLMRRRKRRAIQHGQCVHCRPLIAFNIPVLLLRLEMAELKAEYGEPGS